MKKLQKKEIVSTIERAFEIECDLCGKVNSGDDWKENPTEVKDVEIKIRDGWHDGAGHGCYITTSFDICFDCLKTKFYPWLESYGVKPENHGKETQW